MPEAVLPKVFISYSWSSTEHEEKVLALANQLSSDGVHVVIDKWDLKEGQDKHAFMEKMVTDPSIQRVLVICDKAYAQKADERLGGVGTETQIISQDVYSKVSQDKFLPIIFERDPATGEPFRPTYMKGRIHIDLSTEENYASGYEQLIRNLYGKPLHKRPELGKPPTFLLETTTPVLTTTSKLHFFRDAVTKERAHAQGTLADYFDALSEAFRAETITEFKKEPPPDEQIVASIENFRPYRDEYVSLILFMGRFAFDAKYIAELGQGWERLIQITYSSPFTGYTELRDNLAFILWEMFLYTTAAFIQAGRFEALQLLLERHYYMENEQFSHRGPLRSYPILDPGFRSLDDWRKRRLGLNWISLPSQMLKERMASGPIRFLQLMEADFILFVRYIVRQLDDRWYPRTLVYAENLPGFEQFQRARARVYFDRLKLALGASDLEQLLARVRASEANFPRMEGFWGSPQRYHQLMNLENLAKS